MGTLLRYEQIRRRGAPNVAETDAPYAEGRYFDAVCAAGATVGDFVTVTGESGGVSVVALVDPLTPSTMPSVGTIVSKSAPTACLVQTFGVVSLGGVVAGTWYYLDLTARITATPPALPAIQQVAGIGLESGNLLLVVNEGPLVGGGFLTVGAHHALDDQVHGLAESYVKDITRVAGQVTEVLCHVGAVPIRWTSLTRVAGILTQIDKVQYDAAGAEIHRLTGIIGRTAGKITSVSWTYT